MSVGRLPLWGNAFVWRVDRDRGRGDAGVGVVFNGCPVE